MSQTGSSSNDCIYSGCNKTCSTKGCWWDHLYHQHVNPELYWCKGCNTALKTTRQARKHCGLCTGTSGNKHAYLLAREGRLYYASECLEACFDTPHELVDHLVEFCKIPRESAEYKRYNRKLKSLLNKPAYRTDVANVSTTLLGEPTAWEDLSWDEEEAKRVSLQLEKGVFYVSVHESTFTTKLALIEVLWNLVTSGMQYSGKKPPSLRPENLASTLQDLVKATCPVEAQPAVTSAECSCMKGQRSSEPTYDEQNGRHENDTPRSAVASSSHAHYPRWPGEHLQPYSASETVNDRQRDLGCGYQAASSTMLLREASRQATLSQTLQSHMVDKGASLYPQSMHWRGHHPRHPSSNSTPAVDDPSWGTNFFGPGWTHYPQRHSQERPQPDIGGRNKGQ